MFVEKVLIVIGLTYCYVLLRLQYTCYVPWEAL
jgi:hypothetical protein